MATIVASRFALLSMDDDDDDDSGIYSSRKRKGGAHKKPVVDRNPVPVKSDNSYKKKKNPGGRQSQTGKKAKKQVNRAGAVKENRVPATEQWEEWRECNSGCDDGDDTFDSDLSKALMLSKIDYEKKRDYYESIGKSKELQEKSTTGEKNRKGTSSVSVNEFNQSESESESVDVTPPPPPSSSRRTEKSKEKPKRFDSEIDSDAFQECLSDLNNITDGVSSESLTLVLYQATIDKKDREITELRAEVDRLGTQLKNVKLRNAKLCQIIATGELKDKAEVLMEVQQLQILRDELSSEVASLNCQLQQERSKVRQLMADQKYKDKTKKQLA